MTTNPNTGNYDDGIPGSNQPGGPVSQDPYAPDPYATPAGQQSKSDTAKEEAREVGRESKAAGEHVKETAKGEAKQVAHEAKEKARGLMSELGDDVKSQASSQQQRVASGLRSIGDELRSMSQNSESSGTATNLVGQAADKAGSMAGWLENRDPGSLLDECKRFARQRPGAFLAIAAGAGLLAGRLTRGMTADSGGSGQTGQGAMRQGGAHRGTPAVSDYDYDTQSAAGFAAPGAQTGSALGGAAGAPETIGYPSATPTGATERQETNSGLGGAAGTPETISYPEEPPTGGRGTAIPERDPYEGGGSR
ncbi:hypothetical protein [Crystallibacter degradans]|uniref:hypothetical protein n=1 Tax=Crystallibacter degradans TaxID=2726743 RepID=UPI001473CA23|nr:hypothetical protein [Arthrobacter sp. SF27]NMR29349.1 hypothetical protein [Arthrobacter sp. SF27]